MPLHLFSDVFHTNQSNARATRLSSVAALIFFNPLLGGSAVGLEPIETVLKFGHAVCGQDCELANRLLTSLDAEMRRDGALVVRAIAIADGNTDLVKKTRFPARSNVLDQAVDEEALDRESRIEMLSSRLTPQPVLIAPEDLSPETLKLIKILRRSALVYGLRGKQVAISKLRTRLVNEDLPPKVKNQLLEFVDVCERLAPEFHNSRVAVAIGLATADTRKNEHEEDKQFQMLVEFREATPEKREELLATWALLGAASRGDAKSTSAMDLALAQEQNRPKMIEAMAKLQEAYQKGAITRLECIKKMQEIESGGLDLKQKRAELYAAARKMRAEKNRTRRTELKLARHDREKRAASRNIYVLSPTWPTLFDHRDLKEPAEQLKASLNSYSPENSGPLSSCFSRCVVPMRVLQRTLVKDVEGLSITQRSQLRRYLRELEEELKEPYSEGCYIATAINAPLKTIRPASKIRLASLKPQPVQLSLSGDDTDIASYALYRSILVMVVKAGKQSDRTQLTTLSNMIRDSDLLTANHKKHLNAVGLKIVKGQLDLDELDLTEGTEDVLANIAGLTGQDTGSQLDVPKAYEQEAFEILLATTLPE